ncbi:CPBP family intramembrane glutamic endopeptidase [Aquipuribacter nitratireducens]|uniref:CPBP family intramembrane glutamic endopeptidase n=1 Tax=Aquipuribacter nitratireducens TaxID=650104 RepID=A0ABW0GLQ6_9MICO
MSTTDARPTMSADTPATEPASLPRFLSAALVCGSAVALFGFRSHVVGWPLLAAGVLLALVVTRGDRDRALLRHLAVVAVALFGISLVPLKADISNAGILRFALALGFAVLLPYVMSRFVWREDVIRFPVRTGRAWGRFEWTYLVVVVALGYLVLPVYFIGSGVYENWPTVVETGEIVRLFVGVNAVGLWDELFFVCTVFALLRQHFSFWQANVLQATVFVSFLWELGYQSWGPLLTVPFAVLQGFIFYRTKSFLYVLVVHLSFDLIIFMILVHAHTPSLFDVFVTAPG